MKLVFGSFLAIFSSVTITANADKILVFGLCPAFSHQIHFHMIARELAQRGHDVTYINPYPIKSLSTESYRNIDVSDGIRWAKDWMAKNYHPIDGDSIGNFFVIFPKYFEGILNSTEVQDLMKSKHGAFDLVIAELMWPMTMMFREIFNCPVIAFLTFDVPTYARAIFGNIVHPVLEPDPYYFANPNLTLLDRVYSTWINLVNSQLVRYILNGHEHLSKYFPHISNTPTDVADDADLVIYISSTALTVSSGDSTNFMPVNPLHLSDDATMPQDLKEFLDESKNGVIYLSFGSLIKISELGQHFQEHLVQACEQLSPIQIVMKSEIEIANKPKNLKTFKWLPQQAILKHPHVKLFFSHSGMNSVSEAIHHGVPLVVMPLLNDEYRTANLVVAREIGVQLDKNTITGQEISNAISTVIADKRYKENVMALSKLSRDKPMSPLNTTIWWIEYVSRNKGNPLNKPKRIPLYQYYLLDVFLLVFAAAFIAGLVFLKVSITIVYWGSKNKRDTI